VRRLRLEGQAGGRDGEAVSEVPWMEHCEKSGGQAVKLVNHTAFSSEDLRAFFTAGLKHAGAELDKTITVALSRRGRVHGRAQIGRGEVQGWWIRMWLPADVGQRTKSLAFVFEHEVAHSLGVRHEDMDPAVRWCHGNVTREDFDTLPMPEWAVGFTIRLCPPKTTATLTAQERASMRADHARRMMEKWERKLKLATNKVRKYRRTVRYYEKKGAAGETKQD
jgi:hypothetical protein